MMERGWTSGRMEFTTLKIRALAVRQQHWRKKQRNLHWAQKAGMERERKRASVDARGTVQT
jgi:tRNA A37 N6-isopentenylltransferase MiaA